MEKKASRREFALGVLGLAFAGAGWPRRGGAAVAKHVLAEVDLSFLKGSVDVLRRSQWAAEEGDVLKMRAAGGFERVTFHHEGYGKVRASANDVAYALNGMMAGHKQRAYADIGYHFIIDLSGRLWEGRSLHYEGAHVSHKNPHNIGVVFLGNFEKQQPSTAQVQTMTALVRSLRKQYGIKRHCVYGHRDLAQTACPGRNLYPHVATLRGADSKART